MRETAVTGDMVQEFGTGFLRTTIHRTDQGYLWIRRAGPLRGSALVGPSDEVRTAITAMAAGEVALVLPRATTSGALGYEVTGEVPLVRMVLTARTEADHRGLVPVLRGVGGALRRLHAEVDPLLAAPGPPGPARLAAWMDRGNGPGAARELHVFMRRRLGAARWQRVRAWCDRLAGGEASDVFLHGAPGSGTTVLGGGGRCSALLTGEDHARGPRGFDVGWLLGELAELRIFRSRAVTGGTPRSAAEDRLSAALLEGYGKLTGEGEAVGQAAVLRMLTHAHDFATYVRWDAELEHYGDALTSLIDEGGMGLVPSGI
ncbi:hypothetical protein ABZW10_10900 [Kitasatospora sp. NPDC004723]|uniref:hypothetical protein n=1 Tax=Kitasatospora sp. NPDC004723 TaxID=3154288 RepID=UPI0033A1DD5A